MAISKFRILITGASGLLAYHTRVLLHSINAAHQYNGMDSKYEVVLASTEDFKSLSTLCHLVKGCDVVFHFAGINRASKEIMTIGNQNIATQLISAMKLANVIPHVIYANSTQISSNSLYGQDKKRAGELLTSWASETKSKFTNVILPHLFGECSVPHYNTVTATLCHQISRGEAPEINETGRVSLLHAGKAAEVMLGLFESETTGERNIIGFDIAVIELYQKLHGFKTLYDANQFPDLSEDFSLQLFNTLRSFLFPSYYPKNLLINKDERGILVESVKGGGGGQTFISWTEPGIDRGHHYHRWKVERFLVLSGNARISISKLFDPEVIHFDVNGSKPTVVDMPTLHTHSITNIGSEPLLTLFWVHEIFDKNQPDTYAFPVGGVDRYEN